MPRWSVGVGLAVGLGACGTTVSEPVFNYYPRSVDLGTATWQDDATQLRWATVGLLNASPFALDVTDLELVGTGAPFLEARLRGSEPTVAVDLREGTAVEVRVQAPAVVGVGGWSTGEFEAELRFKVGGSPTNDPTTGEPDPESYVAVDVSVPLSFRLDCDRDKDEHDAQACSGGNDCDDELAAIGPEAVERCDLIDNDCDGAIDDDDVDGCVDAP